MVLYISFRFFPPMEISVFEGEIEIKSVGINIYISFFRGYGLFHFLVSIVRYDDP